MFFYVSCQSGMGLAMPWGKHTLSRQLNEE